LKKQVVYSSTTGLKGSNLRLDSKMRPYQANGILHSEISLCHSPISNVWYSKFDYFGLLFSKENDPGDRAE